MRASHTLIYTCMDGCMYVCMHAFYDVIIILLTIDMSNVLLNELETV